MVMVDDDDNDDDEEAAWYDLVGPDNNGGGMARGRGCKLVMGSLFNIIVSICSIIIIYHYKCK